MYTFTIVISSDTDLPIFHKFVNGKNDRCTMFCFLILSVTPNHELQQEQINVICQYYSTLIIPHLCIDYIWLPKGQQQMVTMPVPQYGYPYMYPMAIPKLNSPGLAICKFWSLVHLQLHL